MNLQETLTPSVLWSVVGLIMLVVFTAAKGQLL